MKLLSIALCAALSIGSGVTLSNVLMNGDEHEHEQHVTKNQIDAQAIYPQYTLEELVNTADIIVYGKVKTKDKPKKNKFTIGSDEKAEIVEEVKTGVQIKVKKSIKNDQDLKVINYIEDGGEIDGITYMPEEGLLEKGEEVIIFVNKEGYAWGPQSVIRVNNGKVDVEGVERDKDEFIEELKSYIK
ncbi:hypothetical protein [Bacillus weihaiensis]|uniref:hypothetical protein n=1 Tax=Bacillus weihaiensis TaxID=1547283 RepID=UPI002356B7F8|nr:hypothetical protein [Bacillus weihaiensis]